MVPVISSDKMNKSFLACQTDRAESSVRKNMGMVNGFKNLGW